MNLNKLEFLLLLLYIPGFTKKENESIKGITRLDKIIFLVQKKLELNIYNFIEYDYGPWSSEIQSDIRLLGEGGLVKIVEDKLLISVEVIDRTDKDEIVNTIEIYSLTPGGEKIAKEIFDKLNNNEKKILLEIKYEFNKIPLTDLIKYVYEKYPEMTTKSKILDKILKSDLYGKRPELIYDDED